jgi:hypothetical protein
LVVLSSSRWREFPVYILTWTISTQSRIWHYFGSVGAYAINGFVFRMGYVWWIGAYIIAGLLPRTCLVGLLSAF